MVPPRDEGFRIVVTFAGSSVLNGNPSRLNVRSSIFVHLSTLGEIPRQWCSPVVLHFELGMNL